MVRVWHVDGTLLKTLNHHKAEVKSVSFSLDGQMLATASADGKVILWNLNLEEMLVQGCQVLRDSASRRCLRQIASIITQRLVHMLAKRCKTHIAVFVMELADRETPRRLCQTCKLPRSVKLTICSNRYLWKIVKFTGYSIPNYSVISLSC